MNSITYPDNRRPVDFTKRQQWLTDLATQPGESIWSILWAHRFDGRIKFWLTHKLLHERQQNATLFAEGDYIPLAIDGLYRDNVMAFARRYEAIWYVVIVPLHTARLCREQTCTILELDWKDTRISLPPNAPAAWTNCLTGAVDEWQNGIQVQAVLSQMPVALLRVG